MSVPGRKPKPGNIRQFEGNREHRPIQNEPKPKPIKSIRCPSHITGTARDIWKRYVPKLQKLGLFTEIDVDTFGMYCILLADFFKYKAMVDAGDDITVAQSGFKQISAAAVLMHKSFDRMMKIATEFGFTPSSRSRIEVKIDDPDDFDEFLK